MAKMNYYSVRIKLERNRQLIIEARIVRATSAIKAEEVITSQSKYKGHTVVFRKVFKIKDYREGPGMRNLEQT